MIVNRYLAKEIFKNLAAVLLVLLFITLSNKLAHYLQKAAAGDLPIDFVFSIVGLYIPELIAFIMPFSMFIAILLAYGKLHADSEMIILFSSGYTWKSITQIAVTIALVLSITLSCLTLWLLPQIIYYREGIISKGHTQSMFKAVTPGEFQSVRNGDMVFYVESKSEDKHKMNGIFIAEQSQKSPWQVITAEHAYIEQNTLSKSFFMHLESGFRYKGNPGDKDYTVIEFGEYGREIAVENTEVPVFDRVKSTTHLLQSQRPGDYAEFQWRVSVPISILILTILGVALSKVNPRQGRFAKFFPGVVIYIVYYNLLLVSKRWVAVGKISPVIGVWWVHGLLFVISLLILGQVSGRLRLVK